MDTKTFGERRAHSCPALSALSRGDRTPADAAMKGGRRERPTAAAVSVSEPSLAGRPRLNNSSSAAAVHHACSCPALVGEVVPSSCINEDGGDDARNRISSQPYLTGKKAME